MKYTSNRILLCLILSSILKIVAGHNCSEEYLKTLGMVFESEETTKSKALLTSYILLQVGSKYGMKPRASADAYFDALKLGLTQFELDSDENNCIRCFSDSTQCVVKHCKAHCMSSPCRRPCIKCIESKCKGALLECIGQDDVVNACRWEKEFLNFKAPLKNIFGTDDEASSSGESA